MAAKKKKRRGMDFKPTKASCTVHVYKARWYSRRQKRHQSGYIWQFADKGRITHKIRGRSKGAVARHARKFLKKKGC